MTIYSIIAGRDVQNVMCSAGARGVPTANRGFNTKIFHYTVTKNTPVGNVHGTFAQELDALLNGAKNVRNYTVKNVPQDVMDVSAAVVVQDH